MNPFKNLNWNTYSAIGTPVLIAIIGISILLPEANSKGGGFYTLPIYFLLIITLCALLFWALRILSLKKRSLSRLTFYIGMFSFTMGLYATILLILLSLCKPFLPDQLLAPPSEYPGDLPYWLISLWALIEGIHHYVYRLLYAHRNAHHLGSAIGRPVLKLKRRMVNMRSR
ncbi:MAG: hypothetical protein Kow0042_22110 [Calditrichia bacterium]